MNFGWGDTIVLKSTDKHLESIFKKQFFERDSNQWDRP